MKTSYFTFGQSHVHRVNGRTFDCDTLVKITADEPREVMASYFGLKWGAEYDEPPKPEYWPRGMIELKP